VKPFADVCKADSVNERFSTSIGRKAMREKIKAAGRPAASTPKVLTSMVGCIEDHHSRIIRRCENSGLVRVAAQVPTPNTTKNV
jgi:hypothetical protein